MTSGSAKPLSICCFPVSAKENSIIDIIYRPLRDKGVRLIDYDWFRTNFAAVDIFHVHWPDAVVMGSSRARILIKFVAFVFSISVFRLRGIPIVYSVHNIGSHEGRHPRLEALLWRWFLPQVTAFVHMNAESVTTFAAWRPDLAGARHEVIPLPYYDEGLGDLRSRGEARRALGMAEDTFIVLNFGLIRPYKGVEDLLTTVRSCDARDLTAVVIGRVVDPGYGRQLQQAAAGDDRIRLDFRFVTDEELATHLKACDLVVMTHRRVNNSATVLMALSKGRPVLAPARGALVELADQIGMPWIILFKGEMTPATLEAARAAVSGLGDGDVPDLSLFEPARLGERLEALYRSVATTAGVVPET